MTDHKPGDVLRLMVATEGLTPGLYGLLTVNGARAAVCAVERFKDGKLRPAGRLHRTRVYALNACFEPTGERLADAPARLDFQEKALRN